MEYFVINQLVSHVGGWGSGQIVGNFTEGQIVEWLLLKIKLTNQRSKEFSHNKTKEKQEENHIYMTSNYEMWRIDDVRR